MESDPKSSLKGLRVVSFESRRAREMAKLIQNYGGEPIVAPSMREIPLSENTEAIEFISQLEAGAVDYLILLTGVGTRALVDAVAEKYPRDRVSAALQKTTLIARGPKPVAALKELGLAPAITAPEPNTWRELLVEVDHKAEIRGKQVAVQEYGISNEDLLSGLKARGARVLRVPVYRWALPDDTGPLQSAIQRILSHQADIVIFTNATQVFHLFQMAREEELDQRLVTAMGHLLLASIGPVCSEALESQGLEADLEPDHPKMGHLLSALSQRARSILQSKRNQ